ncbi:small GTP-binding protein domain-containing protein, partial [Sarcina sp. DSM 11001]|uniref:COR domain-containing protein n=1 Tax=Sarcina sp. DSM 11001 TaxID=1798184 RepID=UPI0008864CF0
SNQISVIPPEIGQLTALTSLDLSGNHFLDFSKLAKNLPRLKILNVSNCVINQLPIEILYQDLPFWDKYNAPLKKRGIFIKGLRLLTQPVSLFLKDRQLIMEYFKEAKIPVNDTKVILLGDGNAGKTYTMERIKGNGKKGDYPTCETHGILITSRTMVSDGKQYNIRFWDFGGQHIMRSMHRCFLSERTCYVVVVSTRLGSMMDQARRWLKTIASFAKGSPVLLVINLIDNDPYRGFAENRIYEEFQDKLDIKGIVHLSVMDASDDEFNYTILKSIKDMALAMDSIEMLFPKSWNDIREELFKETAIEGQYYITQERFQEICRNNHLYEEDIQQWLLDWFNDLGYCVSYGKDIRLSEYKVLNPEWITNAIYILLTSDRVMVDNGIIWRSNIETVLKNPSGGTAPEIDHYEPDECEYILEVMRKFELSYKISDNQEFLPALCDEDITVDPPNKYRSHVASSMVYEFLPENVIHKFMVRSYGRLVRNCCTSKKVMIRDELSALTAILDAGKGDDTLHIDIYAQGDRHPSELLGWIRNEINDINHDLNISAEEYIFINQEEGSIAVRELIDKRELERRENPGRPPRYQGRKAYFFIDELLGELFGDEIVQTAVEVISTPDSKFDSLTPELLLSLTSEDERAHIIRKLRPNIVNVFGDMVLGEKTTTVHNGPSVKDITNLIEVIATEKEASYEFIAKLLDANSNLATAYMEATKQGKKGKLSDMLSNAANLATLGQVISSIPKLASNPAVQQFIETISHFVK